MLRRVLFVVIKMCIWSKAKFVITGFSALFIFSIFVIISLPIYVYRWFLANIVVEYGFADKGIAKPVSSLGNIFATEFLRNFPPRNAIVSNFVVGGGCIQRDEIRKLIQSKWIDAKEGEDNEKEMPKYPELTQYVDYWMGFMFWRNDNLFNLNNHLIFHRIPPTLDPLLEDDASENYVCDLVEELLNKPFPLRQSPWEIHVLENYKNSKLLEKDANNNVSTTSSSSEEMTAFILRFHHGLADGFSLLYAVLEGLFDVSLSEISMASPQNVSSSMTSYHNVIPLTALFTFPWRLAYDIGVFSEKILNRKPTPWHVPDWKKTWKQLYGRSELIPIQKLKDIKNMFGISFTGTLLSCISAGVQKSLSKSGYTNEEDMTTLSPLPLPGHPKGFRNHVTAAIFDLPTSPQLNSLERLIECEQRLQLAKRSTLPQFGVIYAHLVGSHLASVARKLLYNNLIPMGLSNFPGPGQEVFCLNGKKGLAADFVAGAVSGVAGVGFMVLSYRGYIRIAVSAENAIMERDDVDELIRFVCEEIDKLHKLTTSSSKIVRSMSH